MTALCDRSLGRRCRASKPEHQGLHQNDTALVQYGAATAQQRHMVHSTSAASSIQTLQQSVHVTHHASRCQNSIMRSAFSMFHGFCICSQMHAVPVQRFSPRSQLSMPESDFKDCSAQTIVPSQSLHALMAHHMEALNAIA